MSTPRVLAPALAGADHQDRVLRLDADASRHLQVLRVRVGALIRVFDGAGQEWFATVQAVQRNAVEVELGDACPACPESPLRIVIEQGIGKGERMDWTIQKAVELGVFRIQPLVTERTVVRLDEARMRKRLQHWQGVLRSACEQSGRSWLPRLSPPTDLARYWTSLHPEPEALALVLDPQASSGLQALSQQSMPGTIRVLIGPEGGLTDAELSAAAVAGYRNLRLGPRVLRTETAGVVALAALQTLWGDLG